MNIIPTRALLYNPSSIFDQLFPLKAVLGVLSDHCHRDAVMRRRGLHQRCLASPFHIAYSGCDEWKHQEYLSKFPWQRTSGELAGPFVIAFRLSPIHT